VVRNQQVLGSIPSAGSKPVNELERSDDNVTASVITACTRISLPIRLASWLTVGLLSRAPHAVRRTTRLALDEVNVLPQRNATLGHKTGRRCIRARQSLNRGSVRKLSHSGATAR
jgi:hypothetical protein